MKKKYLKLFLVVFLTGCVVTKNKNKEDQDENKYSYNLNSSDFESNKNHKISTDKIIINIDSTFYPRSVRIREITFLNRSNQKINLKFKADEFVEVSPSLTKIAVLSPPELNDSLCNVLIYNNFGDTVGTIKVEPLSGLSISDQATISVYGHRVFTDGIYIISTIHFYDVTGKRLNQTKFLLGGNCKGEFSKNSEFFVLLADSNGLKDDYNPPKECLIFDMHMNLISRNTIVSWPKTYEIKLTQIIINEDLKIITLHLDKGKKDAIYKKTIILDFNGLEISKKEGW